MVGYIVMLITIVVLSYGTLSTMLRKDSNLEDHSSSSVMFDGVDDSKFNNFESNGNEHVNFDKVFDDWIDSTSSTNNDNAASEERTMLDQSISFLQLSTEPLGSLLNLGEPENTSENFKPLPQFGENMPQIDYTSSNPTILDDNSEYFENEFLAPQDLYNNDPNHFLNILNKNSDEEVVISDEGGKEVERQNFTPHQPLVLPPSISHQQLSQQQQQQQEQQLDVHHHHTTGDYWTPSSTSTTATTIGHQSKNAPDHAAATNGASTLNTKFPSHRSAICDLCQKQLSRLGNMGAHRESKKCQEKAQRLRRSTQDHKN